MALTQPKKSPFLALSLFSLLLIGLLLGCSTKSTPPSDSAILGTTGEVAYSYHYWEEGLAILLWHNLSSGSESCSGVGTTELQLYRLMCSVAANDGRHFAWELHTEDGITADLWINYQPYDLSQGNMFLISQQDSGLVVIQLTRDFSQLNPPDNAPIEALATSDEAIVDFINHIQTP